MLGFGAVGEGPLGAPDDDTIGGGGDPGDPGDPQQPYGVHRYWRFRPRAAYNTNNYVYIPELEFRSEPGGAAITGTPFSSGGIWAGNVASRAFDGNTSTQFEAGNVFDDTNWIGLDFGTDVSIVEVMTHGTDGGGERPLQADIDYSDDNSTWTNAWSTGYWSRLVDYNISTSPEWDWGTGADAHLYWRVRTLTTVSGNYTQLCEIEFRETVGGSALNTGVIIAGVEGSGFDPGHGADQAFDGNPTTYSSMGNNDGPGTIWLGRHFDTPREIAEVRLLRRSAGNERPTSLVVEYSDTGAVDDWTEAWPISWPIGTDEIVEDSPAPANDFTLTLDSAAAVVITTQDVTLDFVPTNDFVLTLDSAAAVVISPQAITLDSSQKILVLDAAATVSIAPQAITLSVTNPPETAILEETLILNATIQPAWGLAINEALTLADTLSAPALWSIIEQLVLHDVALPAMTTSMTLQAGLTLADVPRVGFPTTLSETLNFSDVMTGLMSVRILEQLIIAPAITPEAHFGMTLTEALSLSQPLQDFVNGRDLNETLTLTDTISAQQRLNGIITEQLTVELTETHQLLVSAVVEETFELADVSVLGMIYSGELADAIELKAAYISPGGTLATWVMNTRNSAVTEYQNYGFNSFARMGRKYIGASRDGLFELDGPTDDGADITWSLKSGYSQFNGSRRNGFKAIYLAMRGEGDYVLKLDTADGKHYGYKIRAHDGATTKIPIGKGLQARYWSFELIGIGARSELDNLEFVPLRMNRRV